MTNRRPTFDARSKDYQPAMLLNPSTACGTCPIAEIWLLHEADFYLRIFACLFLLQASLDQSNTSTKQKTKQVFRVKKLVGLPPQLELLADSEFVTSQVHDKLFKLAHTESIGMHILHSCMGRQTRTDCAIISFFPLLIRSCTKQSCYSYLAT